jgi:hypothetical protein
MAAGAVLKNSISNKSQQVSLGWSAIDKPTKDHIKSSVKVDLYAILSDTKSRVFRCYLISLQQRKPYPT